MKLYQFYGTLKSTKKSEDLWVVAGNENQALIKASGVADNVIVKSCQDLPDNHEAYHNFIR